MRLIVLIALAAAWPCQMHAGVTQFPAGALTVTSFTATTETIVAYGDSKCYLNGFQPILQNAIQVGSTITPVDSICRNGYDVAMMSAFLASDVAGRGHVSVLLFNLGVNDVSHGLPAEATWKANVLAILDAFHTKWPSISVYIMKVWDRQGPQGDLDTLNSWIDAIVAARSEWTSAGPNEQVWLEGGDDGATMTYDGVHYSAAGNVECAAQWATALGY